MLGYVAPTIPTEIVTFPASNDDEVNWVTKGGVTPVKNQASCGSCWSFSSTGAMEGAHFVASGKLLSFSEQQLVSCSKLNHACNGGSMALAFRFYKKHAAVQMYKSGVLTGSACGTQLDHGVLAVGYGT